MMVVNACDSLSAEALLLDDMPELLRLQRLKESPADQDCSLLQSKSK